jgi:hypothetical protein
MVVDDSPDGDAPVHPATTNTTITAAWILAIRSPLS